MKFSALLAATAITLAPIVAAQEWRLYDGCWNLRLENRPSGDRNFWILWADCRIAHTGGTHVGSGIDLNGCIKNDNGDLYRALNGGFSAYCRHCNIEANSAWLNCECRTRDPRVWKRSRIDLHYFIYNTGGWGDLQCRP